MLKQIEDRFALESLKEDLRKIGISFITAGVVGIFLAHVVSFILSGWLIFLGATIWLYGLYKRRINK